MGNTCLTEAVDFQEADFENGGEDEDLARALAESLGQEYGGPGNGAAPADDMVMDKPEPRV